MRDEPSARRAREAAMSVARAAAATGVPDPLLFAARNLSMLRWDDRM
jgi:hypothetical protein